MRFNEAPTPDDEVMIFRKTPITQQVDYVDGLPFPADTHEFQMDKDTRILQELIFGAAAFGGLVDLDSIPFETFVEITNTSGTNAKILPWTIDGLLSGINMGEVIPDGENAPLDATPTTKPDGFIWWELGPSPSAGGDPTIVMATAPIVIDGSKTSPDVARAEFRYNAVTGAVEFGYDEQQQAVPPLWVIAGGINPAPTALLTYWIRFDVLTGALDTGSDPDGVWLDAYANALAVDKFVRWYVADPGTSQAVTGTFSVEPDTGKGGVQDLDFGIVRNSSLTAVQSA